MKMHHARFSGTVKWSGGRIFVREGQTIDPDHPLLAEHPEYFEERDVQPDIKHGPAPAATDEPPIERGTRAPGERRGRVGGRVPQ